MYERLVFLCGARDFHAMDWYKSSKEILTEKEIIILTDLIAGEGYKKLINDGDKLVKLFILDRFLFRKQSKLGHLWRNALKLIAFPIQVRKIKKFANNHPNSIYYAHSMYYLFLARSAGVPFVGTPQGSDILIKPYSSKLYRRYAIKSLQAAKAVTVDSEKMKQKAFELAGIRASIVQNGIDITAIEKAKEKTPKSRNLILSLRGLTPLYRIKEILLARNNSAQSDFPLTFIYPFKDEGYNREIAQLFSPKDLNIGRVDREKMYNLLLNSLLVLSIPMSDSSPRSVYEAIFCGCAIAISYQPYYDALPECMKERIILTDLNNKDWFEIAFKKAKEIIQKPFIPTDEALDVYDQRRSFKKVSAILFNDTFIKE